MAEPVSLIASAITIASLFNACIESFDYFNAARKHEQDSNLLFVKLDVEKTRMLIWGNSIGILTTDITTRAPIHDWTIQRSVKTCLEQIRLLFTRADQIQSQYGVRPATSTESLAHVRGKGIISSTSMELFQGTYRRFLVWATHQHSSALVSRSYSKVKWAINDKAKFEGLVIHLRDLIDDLHQIIPVDRDVQTSIIKGDLELIVDLSQLRMVESACDKIYQSISDAASAIIEASETGTTDRRNLEENLQDMSSVKDGDDQEESSPKSTIDQSKELEPFNPMSSYMKFRFKKLFFILTDQCSNFASDTVCDSLAKPSPSSAANLPYSFADVTNHPWNIGRLITDEINARSFYYGDIFELETREADLALMLKKQFEEPQPVDTFADMVIYCGPCTCSIHTALSICSSTGISKRLRYLIRVDDRIPVSCSKWSSSGKALASIYDELTSMNPSFRSDKVLLKKLDLQWIEKRLFELDGDPNVDQRSRSASEITLIISHAVSESDTNVAANLILVEAELGSAMMTSHPFPPMPRLPISNQAYQMKRGESGKWEQNHEYLGPISKKRKRTREATAIGSAVEQ